MMYSGIYLEGPRKATKTLILNNQFWA